MNAHVVHYSVLVVGLLGLLAVLGPQWVGGPRAEPLDEHERRVAELHRRIITGSLDTMTATLAPTVATSRPRVGSALLPIMVVSSAAAAGVHSAVGPAHFREQFAFGVFFASVALAQIAWAILVVLQPTRLLLAVGIAGNTALLCLWLITRTVGLPYGLLPAPEAFGLWDLCCAAWEVVVVTTAVHLLRNHPSALPRPRRYDDWPGTARLWMYGSAIVLVALTLSGAHA